MHSFLKIDKIGTPRNKSMLHSLYCAYYLCVCGTCCVILYIFQRSPVELPVARNGFSWTAADACFDTEEGLMQRHMVPDLVSMETTVGVNKHPNF